MAEASVPVRYLDDITACPICKEPYTDPRTLPCIHTFCLKCISHWGQDLQPGDRIACPLCRGEINVPANGFTGFPKNFFIENLLDVRRRNAATVGERLCDLCCDKSSRSEEEKVAVFYCSECEESMCESCAGVHKKQRLTKSHKLAEIDKSKVDDGAIPQKLAESFCEKHDDKRLEIYCFDCTLPLCMMCFVENHQTHKCGNVKAVAEELAGMIKKYMSKLVGDMDKCKDELDKLNKIVKECECKVDSSETEINNRADDLKQLVDQIRDSLLVELRTAKKCHDKKVETLREELGGQMMMVESFRNYSDELLTKGTSCDIVRAASDLQKRARELMQFRGQTDLDKLELNVKFCGGQVDEETIKPYFGNLLMPDSENVTSTLKEPCKQAVSAVCGPYSSLQFSLTASRDVRGVAQCDNKLFVVCFQSNTIEVFGLDNKQQTSITVTGLTRPRDIVACTDAKQLYIADCSILLIHVSGCVWRISLDGQHVDKWPTNKISTTDLYPYSLSLTSRRLLVTSRDNNSLFLFGSDGVQLKHILLSNMEELHHAVETSHETFIVCHDTASQSQISEVDADGQMIRVYYDQQQLGSPHYLALGSDGRVLVADISNPSVLLLNSRLELERVLLDTQDHQFAQFLPQRLCYVEQTNQLIVASMSKNVIRVFIIR